MKSANKAKSTTNQPDKSQAVFLDMEKVIQFLGTEAQLPTIGLPKRWLTTQDKHAEIPLDPKNVNDISFIEKTEGGHVVTETRVSEMKRDNIFTHDDRGNLLLPCFVSGNLMRLESFEADHAQAKENIFKRQLDVIKRLNSDKDFAKRLLEQPNANKFFIEDPNEKGKYRGSKLFYEVYYNDINNIWLICHACNNAKNAQDFKSWIKDQWLFGAAFSSYLDEQKIDDEAILLKVGDNKKGLAQVAIEWFEENQKKYLKNLFDLQNKVVNKIQEFSTIGGMAVAAGNPEKANKSFNQGNSQISIASKAIDATNTFYKDSDSDHSSQNSSDNEFIEAVSIVSNALQQQAENSISLAITSIKTQRSNAEIKQQDAAKQLDRSKRLDKIINDSKHGKTEKFLYNPSQQVLSGVLPPNNSQISFEKLDTARETSSGFDILGLSRAKAINILSGLNNSNNREFLSATIIRALQTNQFQSTHVSMQKYHNILTEYEARSQTIHKIYGELVAENKIDSTYANKKISDHLAEALQQKENSIKALSLSPDTFQEYVSLLIHESIGLDCRCAYLLARERDCNLYIWQNSTDIPNNLESKLFNYEPENQVTYHLLIINDDRFNLLVDKDRPTLNDQIDVQSDSLTNNVEKPRGKITHKRAELKTEDVSEISDEESEQNIQPTSDETTSLAKRRKTTTLNNNSNVNLTNSPTVTSTFVSRGGIWGNTDSMTPGTSTNTVKENKTSVTQQSSDEMTDNNIEKSRSRSPSMRGGGDGDQ